MDSLCDGNNRDYEELSARCIVLALTKLVEMVGRGSAYK